MSIAIIGGGMAGTTLALALSYLSHGTLEIDLVEEKTWENHNHSDFNSRALALAYGTCRELNDIGIWPALASYATPITVVEVSDKGHFGKLQIIAEDYRIPALGYVIELCIANKIIFQLLREARGVRLHCPKTLMSLKREYDKVIVTLDNGVVLNPQLVVAADGERSSLASQCGIQWHQHDYHQIAVISYITTDISHCGKSFERFTVNGPLALLPMSKARSSLVWCLPSSLQKEIVGWNDSEFCLALQKEFGWRLGRISIIGSRQYYSLRSCISHRYISHRLALVGNAAQTLHPIAGQGLNLGLRDVITLAEILTQVATKGKDIGDYAVLLQYQQRRQLDRANILNITNGLIHLFNNSYLPLVIGRNLGLFIMDHFPFLRNTIVHKTLGWVIR